MQQFVTNGNLNWLFEDLFFFKQSINSNKCRLQLNLYNIKKQMHQSSIPQTIEKKSFNFIISPFSQFLLLFGVSNLLIVNIMVFSTFYCKLNTITRKPDFWCFICYLSRQDKRVRMVLIWEIISISYLWWIDKFKTWIFIILSILVVLQYFIVRQQLSFNWILGVNLTIL